ncbi:hypothetical protein JAO82_08240 [Pontibaca sp. S1109L]|uniref:Uncharacterized protein n=2 Tax=Pontibaca salina TaxID=2795731 RepID=A0A934HR08_9RHOB|nr:hypothetical protein [Pontibaca salina]
MVRLALALTLLVTPALATGSDKESCAHQADIVAAIQQARLNNVAEADVGQTILADPPTWPENYNAAIPVITPWVYEQNLDELRDQDLAAIWNEMCL